MNVLTVTGALGKDCRTNTVNGQFVANFSVAVSSGYGANKSTIWIDCSYWGKGAEAVAGYLVKGCKVAVTGEMSHRDDGQYGWKILLRVNALTLIGARGDAASASGDPAPPGPVSDDDVPF